MHFIVVSETEGIKRPSKRLTNSFRTSSYLSAGEKAVCDGKFA